MVFHYPYSSSVKTTLKSLREGQDYFVWQDGVALEDRLVDAKGPIIEIGGPTDTGFFFLSDLDLSSEPIITNISANPSPYAENPAQIAQQVKQLMDARDMPYEDDSIGVFLMAFMSFSSDWWVELDEAAKEESKVQFERENDIAKLEMGQVALGIMKSDKVVHAQRIQIYREIYRTLRGGGLFFTDGSIEDIDILKQLGFKLVAFLQYRDRDAEGWHGLNYEFVVIK